MESGRSNGSSIRGGAGGKKMRKRKELDALVGGVGVKRVGGGNKRPGSGGVSPQDQLLSDSTGDEDYWSTTKITSKGKRHYSSPGGKRGSGTCSALLRLCTILLIIACVIATITVMWLFIDIREQTTYLRSQLDQVSAGSEGLPEQIQKCHSLSRQLQLNQTSILSQIDVINIRLYNLTKSIGVIQGGLNEVVNKLKASPELVNVPNQLESLKASIATLGSEFEDMKTTTAHLQETQETTKQLIGNLNLNVTNINMSVLQINETMKKQIGHAASVPDFQELRESLTTAIIDVINPNITNVNDSLSKRLDWVSEDQKKDYKLIIDLQETSANLSSQLLSLRDNVFHVYTNCSTLNSQMATLKNNVNKLSSDDVDGLFAQHKAQPASSVQLPMEGIGGVDNSSNAHPT